MLNPGKSLPEKADARDVSPLHSMCPQPGVDLAYLAGYDITIVELLTVSSTSDSVWIA
jgi:hypothetical protein